MNYTRIYASPDGHSHFEDVTITGEVRKSPVSSGVSEYASPIPATAVVLRRVLSAHPAEPHVSPRRQIIVNLQSSVDVEVSDGESRRFGPGSVLVLEDASGTGHITREVDDGQERVSMFIELPDGPAD
jgi:hypothetical protein